MTPCKTCLLIFAVAIVWSVLVQVFLLHNGKERGRMYAGYALSSIISANTDMTELRAAGAIPALVAVLTTSKVCKPVQATPLCSWSSSQHATQNMQLAGLSLLHGVQLTRVVSCSLLLLMCLPNDRCRSKSTAGKSRCWPARRVP